MSMVSATERRKEKGRDLCALGTAQYSGLAEVWHEAYDDESHLREGV